MRELAIATVITPGFEPGTLVTIGSFLDCNPWFDGPIYILYNDMEVTGIRKFFSYAKVEFHRVDEEIVSAADSIARVMPQYQPRVAQFYSLSLFQFSSVKNLLFLDSDLLFRGSILKLIQNSEGVCVCGDGYFYKGFEHNRVDYQKQLASEGNDGICGFNAGFILFNDSTLQYVDKASVMRYLNVDYFTSSKTNHSDQLIFNLLLEDKVRFISAEYNYRIGISDQIQLKDGVSLDDAKVIHYTARKKPWRLMQTVKAGKNNPLYIQTFKWWMDAWVKVIENNKS